MLLVVNCVAIVGVVVPVPANQARPERSDRRGNPDPNADPNPDHDPNLEPEPQPDPKSKLREYSPGVRIDWQQPAVEVDATICLRKGVLELLACSRQTREHESILAVRARPIRIHQAMGLIGLKPGSPARYDSKRAGWVEASGEALRLEVRYRTKDAEKAVPIEQWLFDTKSRRSPKPLNWVFAGSRNLGNGRFGADVEGTIVTVVDFDTALIALGSVHSSDNQLLWLAANTPVIPPVGTTCTLVIRAAGGTAIEVEVTADEDRERPDPDG